MISFQRKQHIIWILFLFWLCGVSADVLMARFQSEILEARYGIDGKDIDVKTQITALAQARGGIVMQADQFIPSLSHFGQAINDPAPNVRKRLYTKVRFGQDVRELIFSEFTGALYYDPGTVIAVKDATSGTYMEAWLHGTTMLFGDSKATNLAINRTFIFFPMWNGGGPLATNIFEGTNGGTIATNSPMFALLYPQLYGGVTALTCFNWDNANHFYGFVFGHEIQQIYQFFVRDVINNQAKGYVRNGHRGYFPLSVDWHYNGKNWSIRTTNTGDWQSSLTVNKIYTPEQPITSQYIIEKITDAPAPNIKITPAGVDRSNNAHPFSVGTTIKHTTIFEHNGAINYNYVPSWHHTMLHSGPAWKLLTVNQGVVKCKAQSTGPVAVACSNVTSPRYFDPAVASQGDEYRVIIEANKITIGRKPNAGAYTVLKEVAVATGLNATTATEFLISINNGLIEVSKGFTQTQQLANAVDGMPFANVQNVFFGGSTAIVQYTNIEYTPCNGSNDFKAASAGPAQGSLQSVIKRAVYKKPGGAEHDVTNRVKYIAHQKGWLVLARNSFASQLGVADPAPGGASDKQLVLTVTFGGVDRTYTYREEIGAFYCDPGTVLALQDSVSNKFLGIKPGSIQWGPVDQGVADQATHLIVFPRGDYGGHANMFFFSPAAGYAPLMLGNWTASNFPIYFTRYREFSTHILFVNYFIVDDVAQGLVYSRQGHRLYIPMQQQEGALLTIGSENKSINEFTRKYKLVKVAETPLPLVKYRIAGSIIPGDNTDFMYTIMKNAGFMELDSQAAYDYVPTWHGSLLATGPAWKFPAANQGLVSFKAKSAGPVAITCSSATTQRYFDPAIASQGEDYRVFIEANKVIIGRKTNAGAYTVLKEVSVATGLHATTENEFWVYSNNGIIGVGKGFSTPTILALVFDTEPLTKVQNVFFGGNTAIVNYSGISFMANDAVDKAIVQSWITLASTLPENATSHTYNPTWHRTLYAHSASWKLPAAHKGIISFKALSAGCIAVTCSSKNTPRYFDPAIASEGDEYRITIEATTITIGRKTSAGVYAELKSFNVTTGLNATTPTNFWVSVDNGLIMVGKDAITTKPLAVIVDRTPLSNIQQIFLGGNAAVTQYTNIAIGAGAESKPLIGIYKGRDVGNVRSRVILRCVDTTPESTLDTQVFVSGRGAQPYASGFFTFKAHSGGIAELTTQSLDNMPSGAALAVTFMLQGKQQYGIMMPHSISPTEFFVYGTAQQCTFAVHEVKSSGGTATNEPNFAALGITNISVIAPATAPAQGADGKSLYYLPGWHNTLFSQNGAWKLPTAGKGLITFNAQSAGPIAIACSSTNAPRSFNLVTTSQGDEYRVTIEATKVIIGRRANNGTYTELKEVAIATGLNVTTATEYWISINNGNIIVGKGAVATFTVLATVTDPAPLTNVQNVFLGGDGAIAHYTALAFGEAIALGVARVPTTVTSHFVAEGGSAQAITLGTFNNRIDAWYVGKSDGKLYTFDIKSPAGRRWIDAGFTEKYRDVSSAHDGTLVAVLADGRPCVLDRVAKKATILATTPTTLKLKSIVAGSSTAVYGISEDNKLCFYNAQTQAFTVHTLLCQSIGLGIDGSFMYVDAIGIAYAYANNQSTRIAAPEPLHSLAVATSTLALACGRSGQLYQLNNQQFAPVAGVKGLVAMAISPVGTIYAFDSDGKTYRVGEHAVAMTKSATGALTFTPLALADVEKAEQTAVQQAAAEQAAAAAKAAADKAAAEATAKAKTATTKASSSKKKASSSKKKTSSSSTTSSSKKKTSSSKKK